tara:strand:- start:75846 stop:76004 length:159 start_codon:yes stop_codon:yes gene_type:complete
MKNKINKFKREIQQFEESLEKAKNDNKKHLVRRLELMIKHKKDKLKKLILLH